MRADECKACCYDVDLSGISQNVHANCFRKHLSSFYRWPFWGNVWRPGQRHITQWQMSHQDGSVYEMLSARPLASRHAKLDLIWHLFSNINILFWCENSLAVPWTASVWWMMPEMEEDVFIFSWLSTCRPDWNGLAIVYKFFWSDPSMWTCLSWPWPLRPLSYWPEAAVYTVCHVHIAKAMNPNYECFSPLSLLIYILL